MQRANAILCHIKPSTSLNLKLRCYQAWCSVMRVACMTSRRRNSSIWDSAYTT